MLPLPLKFRLLVPRMPQLTTQLLSVITHQLTFPLLSSLTLLTNIFIAFISYSLTDTLTAFITYKSTDRLNCIHTFTHFDAYTWHWALQTLSGLGSSPLTNQQQEKPSPAPVPQLPLFVLFALFMQFTPAAFGAYSTLHLTLSFCTSTWTTVATSTSVFQRFQVFQLQIFRNERT